MAALLLHGQKFHKKNALAMVCFNAFNHIYSRHRLACQWNILSFMAVSPEDDILVVTPNPEWVPEEVRKISKEDSSVKIETVGEGPYALDNGKSVSLFGRDEGFTGNGLRQLWMLDLLKKYANDYQHVAIVDGADVMFQKNPFDLMQENPNADVLFFGDRGDDQSRGRVYFQARTSTIGLGFANGEFHHKVDKAFFNEEQNYSVYANGGALCGKLQAAMEIQNQMKQISIASGYWHSDQGQMNIARYLYGEKHGKEKVVCYPDYSRSITMGHLQKWSSFTKDGFFANAQGMPITLLHQFGRSRYSGQAKNALSKLIQPVIKEKDLKMQIFEHAD